MFESVKGRTDGRTNAESSSYFGSGELKPLITRTYDMNKLVSSGDELRYSRSLTFFCVLYKTITSKRLPETNQYQCLKKAQRINIKAECY